MNRAPLLSVLVPTLPSRLAKFAALARWMDDRIKETGAHVEVVALYDNKQCTVGEKRNRLLELAHGQFVAFVDDDDTLAPTYFVDIVDALHARPDAHVVVFDSVVTVKGRYGPKRCVYGVEFEYTETQSLWTGKPAHTMVWRAELARRARFPDRNCDEDSAWVRQAWPLVDPAKQVRVNKVLYYYNQDPMLTETQK